jgi:hypothetical protein
MVTVTTTRILYVVFPGAHREQIDTWNALGPTTHTPARRSSNLNLHHFTLTDSDSQKQHAEGPSRPDGLPESTHPWRELYCPRRFQA